MKEDKITIKIEQQSLLSLKKAGYYLCLAGRPKGEAFTVIWYATDKYQVNNQIELKEEYEMGASNGVTLREEVKIDFSHTPIQIGEQCTIDSYGILSQSITGDTPDAMVLNNQYGLLHPLLMRSGVGIQGEAFCNPVYVSHNEILPGIMELFPGYEIKIWFAQSVMAGMVLPIEYKKLLRAARSNEIIIDFEKRNSPELYFENYIWKITK